MILPQNKKQYIIESTDEVSPSEAILKQLSLSRLSRFFFVLADQGVTGMQTFFRDTSKINKQMCKFLADSQKDEHLSWFRKNFLSEFEDYQTMNDSWADFMLSEHYLTTYLLSITDLLGINENNGRERSRKKTLDFYIKNQLNYGVNFSEKPCLKVTLARKDVVTNKTLATYTLYFDKIDDKCDDLPLFYTLFLKYYNYIRIEPMGGAVFPKKLGEKIKQVNFDLILQYDIKEIKHQVIEDGFFEMHLVYKKGHFWLKDEKQIKKLKCSDSICNNEESNTALHN